MTRKEEIELATMQVGGVHPDWDALECFRVGYKEGAKWADKTMIEKACEWAKKRFDLDYCSNVKELLDYLKSLVEE